MPTEAQKQIANKRASLQAKTNTLVISNDEEIMGDLHAEIHFFGWRYTFVEKEDSFVIR